MDELNSTQVITTNVSGIIDRSIQLESYPDIISNVEILIDIELSGRSTSPSLQYWFGKFIQNGGVELNKYKIPYLDFTGSLYETLSFLELIFNDNYTGTRYRYLYRNNTDTSTWPESIRQRMKIYPSRSLTYYICDGDDPNIYYTNLYNLKSDDLTMLDRLLTYRTQPGSATIDDIDYESLTTNISKLLYIYLDAMINNSLENYNHNALISNSDDLFESFLEVYVIENIFQVVSKRGITNS